MSKQREKSEVTVEWVKTRCRACGDCLIWEQSKACGTPVVYCFDQGQRARIRLRDFMWLGSGRRSLFSGFVLQPQCGERFCVNPEHLKQITYSEMVKQSLTDAVMLRKSIAQAKVFRASGRCKLSEDDVIDIRSSDDTGRAMARKYGVTPQAIYQIRAGHIWRDLRTSPFAGLGAR